jgi:hypothetical protein
MRQREPSVELADISIYAEIYEAKTRKKRVHRIVQLAARVRMVNHSKHAEHEATGVAACRELLDRGYGKASQPVEAKVQTVMSAELQRLLQECDGQSRSIPARENGTLLLAPEEDP